MTGRYDVAILPMPRHVTDTLDLYSKEWDGLTDEQMFVIRRLASRAYFAGWDDRGSADEQWASAARVRKSLAAHVPADDPGLR